MIFNIPIAESVNASSLKIIKDPSSYIIKNNNGTTISKLNYYDYNIKNFDWILVANLETLPKYRGKGLATRLINELYKDITKTTNKGIYLFVRVNNINAISLYNKLGFKTIKNYKLSGKEYIIMAKGNADTSQFNKFTFA